MKKLAVLFLSVVFAMCFCINAFALSESIDMDKKGSLSVTMECSHGYRSGGKVGLYAVATICSENNNYFFEYTQAFKDCPLSLDNISNDLEADRFYAYATDAGIECELRELIDGTAIYENLPVGLYLVVHAQAENGFTTALPFFVTIPASDGEHWDYSVDAAPKVEVKHSELDHPQDIPQTGQLKWPIPIMAVSGVMIFVIGLVIFKRSKTR